jgi:ribonucleoside-diphosphate reductase beta chain
MRIRSLQDLTQNNGASAPFITNSIMTNLLTAFKLTNNDPLRTPIFLGEEGTTGISRSDIVKYPIFTKQHERMWSYHWKPQEINLTKDKADFNALDEAEKFIFLSNLRRQIMLDSQQSLCLGQAFKPILTNPEVKRCINTIEFFEEIHAFSYEYIVKNVFNDPSEIFNGLNEIREIVKASNSISRYYDELITMIAKYRLGIIHKREMYRPIWLTLHSIAAMEGLRFYDSFCCTFSFAERGTMVGNASEIRLIANDEALHVAFIAQLIKLLPQDDENFARVAAQCKEEVTAIFLEVVKEEKDFAEYLFSKGTMIGLSKEILSSFIDHMAAKRMNLVGLVYPYESPKNSPVPFMGRWLNEANTQVAPQETELTGYQKVVSMDIDENSFAGISL